MRGGALLLLLTAASSSWASPLGAQARSGSEAARASDPSGEALELREVLRLLAERSPRLRAAEARTRAAAARVEEASTLPDPALQLGAMNFSLPELETDMPNSMAPWVQLTQRVPFPGTLGREGEMAETDRAMAEAAASESWWMLRERAAGAFYELYSRDRQLEVMRETSSLLRDFQTVAEALYASGTGRQTDVLRATVEVARIDGEIQVMEAGRRAAAARLNGLLDRPATTPVASPVLAPLPSSTPPHDTLAAWSREGRPLLRRGRLAVTRAETGVELARRAIWPDLTVGIAYGQRGTETGTRRMGSATLGVTLPVHAGARQLAAREEAGARVRTREAELAELEAGVEARIAEIRARLERDRSLVRLYHDEILPEARATVESALSSYRVGAVDFATLVDAQLAVNRYETELHRLLADYGAGVAALESAVARSLPANPGPPLGIPTGRSP
jgi:outer membrane protein TolC